jgi:hypothetical protein
LAGSVVPRSRRRCASCTARSTIATTSADVCGQVITDRVNRRQGAVELTSE